MEDISPHDTSVVEVSDRNSIKAMLCTYILKPIYTFRDEATACHHPENLVLDGINFLGPSVQPRDPSAVETATRTDVSRRSTSLLQSHRFRRAPCVAREPVSASFSSGRSCRPRTRTFTMACDPCHWRSSPSQPTGTGSLSATLQLHTHRSCFCGISDP